MDSTLGGDLMGKAQTSANEIQKLSSRTNANEMQELCFKIRKMILEYDKPFCTTDLKAHFREANVGDDELVLAVLDKLFNEGLVVFRFVGKPGDEFCDKDSEGRSNYAFVVV